MAVSTIQMRIHKYIPEKLYGFLLGEGSEVFFHLGAFDPGPPPLDEDSMTPGVPVPPILGELVEVQVDLESGTGKAPRALRVTRATPPVVVKGIVETFDHIRGFGFAKDSHGVSYHLHKSEVLEGKIPLAGQQVTFYAGVRQGRPRACHVKVCI